MKISEGIKEDGIVVGIEVKTPLPWTMVLCRIKDKKETVNG